MRLRNTFFTIGVLTMAVVLAAPHAARAQAAPAIPPYAHTVNLAGPRFGFTILSDQTVDRLRDYDVHVGTSISQFGWQFEKQLFSRADGPTVLSEWVPLVGGLDQGVVIPSLSWLVGIRTKEGAEFGVGPNVSP